MTRIAVAVWLFAAGAALAQDSTQKCGALASAKGLPNATTTISSAVLNASGAQPEHCEVLGKINDRTGVNNQHYAIKFHLRLPSNWNGKFFFEGGGGSNGNLGNALGNLQGQQRGNALSLGYAVVSQDSGHDNRENNDPQRNGAATFGFDPQARLDFGYNSYDQVTQAAKALIRIYYGRSPERSYFVGCSEGGREGMMMSQRFPDYFDGILACSPGFKLPKAALYGHSWDAQSFAEVAKADGIYDRFGQPLLNKTFTDEDLDLAAQAILGACDELDGLKDGMIVDFPACTAAVVGPKLDALVCKGPKRVSCLAAAQVAAIKKVMAGARDSKGDMLYSDWAWDRGIGGKLGDAYNQGWRSWKIGAYDAPANSAIIVGLGSGAVSAIFSTPPVTIPAAGAGPVAYLMGIDLAKDAGKIYAESAEYSKSSWDFMMASSTELSKFHAHGGKLVIVQGVSDPVFSINDTIRWWNDVNQANGGNAAAFARLFAVPGMNHCAGGPATDRFDAFSKLVDWVEKNAAPEKITATAGPATPWPGRTRPLCVYPAQARYNGSGSIEEAANFSCKP
ncbi:MAG TPA: tannase/feruloyl esterase family alpha/beta hydrolase [Bryobacteraceae bacterium]|jgi:feruloyl esterase